MGVMEHTDCGGKRVSLPHWVWAQPSGRPLLPHTWGFVGILQSGGGCPRGAPGLPHQGL